MNTSSPFVFRIIVDWIVGTTLYCENSLTIIYRHSLHIRLISCACSFSIYLIYSYILSIIYIRVSLVPASVYIKDSCNQRERVLNWPIRDINMFTKVIKGNSQKIALRFILLSWSARRQNTTFVLLSTAKNSEVRVCKVVQRRSQVHLTNF